MNLLLKLFFLFVLFLFVACAPAHKQSSLAPLEASKEQVEKRAFLTPPSIPDLATGKEQAPTRAELKEQFREAGSHWLYSSGLGKTMVNIGTVVLFPPYAFYLIGNAGLALAGAEPLYITDVLPETPRKSVNGAYDAVTSVPGRIAATIAGQEFETD